MNCINKISELGDSFFNWVLNGIIPLPGIIKGFITIVVFTLVALGILSLLRKSFKIFGIILLVIFVIALVSMLTSK